MEVKNLVKHWNDFHHALDMLITDGITCHREELVYLSLILFINYRCMLESHGKCAVRERMVRPSPSYFLITPYDSVA